jgi:hypothetical protein
VEFKVVGYLGPDLIRVEIDGEQYMWDRKVLRRSRACALCKGELWPKGRAWGECGTSSLHRGLRVCTTCIPRGK